MPRGLKLGLLLALCAMTAHSQDKPINVTQFSNRAVTEVVTHVTRNPGAYVIGTETPISLAGKWSIKKYGVQGCNHEAFACVDVLYTPPNKENICEWTVQIDPDSPTRDTIIALNTEAARDYLLLLTPDDATRQSSATPQPPFFYPALARASNTTGAVTLRLNIDTTGTVTSVRTLSGPTLLRDSVEDTFRHWTFTPRLLAGKPIASFAYAQVDLSPTKQSVHFLSTAPSRPRLK